MSFYGANVGAKLFMGTATSDPLPAFLSDTYTEVPLTGTITPPPKTLSTAFFNITNDAERRSLGGSKGDKVLEGTLVIDWDEAVHVQMHDDADTAGGVKRNWYWLYPTGRKEYSQGFLSNWAESPFEAGENAVEHRSDFSITLNGATLVVP